MNAPAPRVRVLSPGGRRLHTADIEDLCDADRAARARRQYAGGAARALSRVVPVPATRRHP